MVSKVITNFENVSDDGINTIALNVIAGCTDNLDFVFTKSELINLTTYQVEYAHRLSEMSTGGIMETAAKNEAKTKLANGLRVICLQINVQHAGNLTVLQSSGAPLSLHNYLSKEGIKVIPTDLKGVPGTKASELNVSMKKPAGVSDHGSMFAINEAITAPDDVNLWQMKYCTGHHLTITGLKPGYKYVLAGALQGPSGTALKFCSPITVWTKYG